MSDSMPDPAREEVKDSDRRGSATCGLPACAKVKAGYAQGRSDLPSLRSFLFLTSTSPPTVIGVHPMEGPAVSARWEPEAYYSSSEFILGEILNILLAESDSDCF